MSPSNEELHYLMMIAAKASILSRSQNTVKILNKPDIEPGRIDVKLHPWDVDFYIMARKWLPILVQEVGRMRGLIR